MLQSMTGFGKSVTESENKKITVEVKSLNNKQLDFSIKIPVYYREKELDIRNHLSNELKRGKVELYLNIESQKGDKNIKLNETVFNEYYNQINSVSQKFNFNTNDVVSDILKLPEVFKSETPELNQNEWQKVFETIKNAVKNLIEFRQQEGKALQVDILKRVELIKKYLSETQTFEKERIEAIKQRLKLNLAEFENDNKIDKNRFEQELIYFFEKLDITEEKTRLTNHCKYFIETIENEEVAGKKLNFIAQEILREINTIGSKASHSGIQHLVVQMKDELEKIKEQIMNVL